MLAGLLVWLGTSAQISTHVERYTVDDGLAQDVVLSMLQDSRGFMWLSTWNGLSRWDGREFRNYRTLPTDSVRMGSNRINAMVADTVGNLWCLSDDRQVYLFCTATERFVNVTDTMSRPGRVMNLRALPRSGVWLTMEDGRVMRASSTLRGRVTTEACCERELRGATIYKIADDPDGDTWVLSSRGACIVGGKHLEDVAVFTHQTVSGSNIWLASAAGRVGCYNATTGAVDYMTIHGIDSDITALSRTTTGRLLVGCASGRLLAYDVATDATAAVSLPTQRPGVAIASIHVDDEGCVWVQNGAFELFCHNPATGITFRVDIPVVTDARGRRSKYQIVGGMRGICWVYQPYGKLFEVDVTTGQARQVLEQSVHICYADRQRNLWINTVERELLHMVAYRTNYQLTPTPGAQMPESEVRSLMVDRDDRLWVGAKDGTLRIYDNPGSSPLYVSRQGTLSTAPAKFGANIYCLAQDADGNVWAGSRHSGLFVLRRRGDSYTVANYRSQRSDKYSISGNAVYSVLHADDGTTWVGTFDGGLNLVRRDVDGNPAFINVYNELTGYPQDHYLKVRSLEQVGRRVLVSTGHGLLAFDLRHTNPSDISFRSVELLPANVSTNVMQTLSTADGMVCVAMLGRGLASFCSADLASDAPPAITLHHPGIDNRCDMMQSMIAWPDSSVWMLSEHQLCHMDNSNFEIYGSEAFYTTFSYSEARPAMWRGHLVCGTSDGFVIIAPNMLTKSAYEPPIAFTSMHVRSRQQTMLHAAEVPGIDRADTVRLDRTQRNVTISFAALDFTGADDIVYAYRLEGVDDDWNYSHRNNTANYLNLPCGEHRFTVRSTNAAGVWADNHRTLTLVVEPTFVETPAFVALCVALLIAVMGLVVWVTHYIFALRHAVDVEQEVTDMKLHFFTNISHELRTPLTLIASPVEEVLDNEPLSDEARSHLRVVQANADRMLRLVSQLLDFRKLQEHKMSIMVERTDVPGAVEAVVSNFRAEARARGLSLDLEVAGRDIRAYVDTDKFEKIMYNLLSNAIKYTERGGVTVRVSAEAGDVVIAVSDTGCGIDHKDVGTVFERFGTLDGSPHQGPSTGIGLTLAREYAQMHHGSLDVASEPGRGSTFTVRLPAGREFYDDSQVVEPAAHPDDDADTERTQVVVVEDNAEMRSFLTAVLGPYYTVYEAANGREGLAMIREYMPDIVVTDIMMPGMDGNAMIAAMRADDAVCHIPVVALTARTSTGDRLQTLETGADEYLTKPFSAAVLRFTIDRAVSSIRAARHDVAERMAAGVGSMQPLPPSIQPADERFVEKVMEYMEANMDNSELTIDDFAAAMALSRTVFYRKLKAITGLSPVDFVKDMRVKRAVQLIGRGGMTLSQIAFMTGFNDPKYFSKCFKRQMGMTPSDYKDRLENENRPAQ